MSERPDWALRDDGSLGNTDVPKLDRAQEHFARLASERYERILEVERSNIELSGEAATLRDRAQAHLSAMNEMRENQAVLAQERDKLQEAVQRLSAPVSDEEWAAHESAYLRDECNLIGYVDRIIAARKAQP